VRDDEGALLAIRGTSQDVTAPHLVLTQLRSARDYLRAVTDRMAEGMCTLDPDGRAIYMNRAAERILGCTSETMMGRFFEEEVLPARDGALTRALRHAESARGDDGCFVRSDGSLVPVEFSAEPFETTEGIRGTVLLFSDISERKAREAEMARELEDLAWIARINDAIEQDRFVLHAQPIIDLSTGATVQHELLIRMSDADGSPIAPGRFLPAAERYGLIREVDRWVARRAFAYAAEGHAVELNVSAESLGDPNFAVMVERELALAGADCSLIVFELTETALMRDEEAGGAFVDRVKRLGCRVALDDFGTGYGGFTYLKRFDVDLLKIDIEFVRDLPRNAASQHVVRAVVSLARGFGQKTVAEGVEDAETLALLGELGVDLAQGYHLGRPAPAGDVLRQAARARPA